ncbi:MAG: ABC transporter permease [Hyphomicrobiaceae bacterium]
MSRLGIGPLKLYGLLFIVYLYGPVLLMSVFSFNDNIFAVFPLKAFTLKHYQAAFANQSLINALWNSVRVAVIVSTVSTFMGLLAAMATTRYRLPFQGPVVGTIMLPLVVPSIIFGVGILVVLRKVLDVELSLATVAAGHVMLCVPFSMLVLVSRLEGFDRSLEEASADLGERPLMTFWRVTLPLAIPGIVSSFLMCFTVSFDEFVLAFFLSGTEQTLPIFLYSQLRFPQKLPSMLALGSTILLASTIIVVTAELMRKRGIQPGTPSGI